MHQNEIKFRQIKTVKHFLPAFDKILGKIQTSSLFVWILSTVI